MTVEAASLTKLAPLISKLAEAFAAPAKGLATRAKERLEIKLRKGFAQFLTENFTRFSTVKTIISSSTPVPFLTLYVNLHVKCNETTFRDEDLLADVSRLKNVFFTARAGSGKSMLMRYLFLRFLEIQTERLPVFVELRELNEHRKRSLQEHIRLKIADYIEGFSEHQLKYALETGRIIVFLDGLDEVDHDQRKQRERQIIELTGRYNSLWTFVSCRPPETLAPWQTFHAFEIQPLSKAQVELLVKKIPYDADAKATFERKLASGLYESHEQFLTNPLLTIMMLVTLEQFAEVPAKIHLFYEYAFEALFGRHDATKAGFQRKRHTALAMDDFKRLFSYFCMITYAKQARTFSFGQTLDFIQKAIDSSQIKVDKSLFKLDLTESICMLVRDGLDYTFSHRSFQEYFVSYFLSRVTTDEFEVILPRIINRAYQDSVIAMVAEMNRERFEEAWALPTLTKIWERVRAISPQKNCVAFDASAFQRWPFVSASAFVDAGEDGNHGLISLDAEGDEGPPEEQEWLSSRYVLYDVYGQFDAMDEILSGPDSDYDLIAAISRGDLLGDDSRFAKWRAIEPEGHVEYPKVRLEDTDHTWLSQSHWGRVLQFDGEAIPKLLNDIKIRVDSRRKGIESMFERSD